MTALLALGFFSRVRWYELSLLATIHIKRSSIASLPERQTSRNIILSEIFMLNLAIPWDSLEPNPLLTYYWHNFSRINMVPRSITYV